MTFCHTVVLRFLIMTVTLTVLSGCDFISSMVGGQSQKKDVAEVPTLTLAVSPYVAWMPWFLAAEERSYEQYVDDYKVNIQFVSDTYSNTIEKFIKKDVQAVAITNIDAIVRLIKQGIEADVILITSYNHGNDAIILLRPDDEPNLRGKTIGVIPYSSRHYLLDRYLTKNQIPFNEVTIQSLLEADMSNALANRSVYGVVAGNPTVYKIVQEYQAKVLFDSRQIPEEIIDLIVVRRETLDKYPGFAQALLATWFTIMDKLQGNTKGITLDSMARLAGISREEYDEQMAGIKLMDNPTKALSSIRDRRAMIKTMRHIRYFAERYNLTGREAHTEWVSYPGRDRKLLHFNGEPLQTFVAPLGFSDSIR